MNTVVFVNATIGFSENLFLDMFVQLMASRKKADNGLIILQCPVASLHVDLLECRN